MDGARSSTGAAQEKSDFVFYGSGAGLSIFQMQERLVDRPILQRSEGGERTWASMDSSG